MVHNIQRLQGEKKNGVEMVVHSWEQEDNFLDNFTFSNKTPDGSCWVAVPQKTEGSCRMSTPENA